MKEVRAATVNMEMRWEGWDQRKVRKPLVGDDKPGEASPVQCCSARGHSSVRRYPPLSGGQIQMSEGLTFGH